MNIEQLPDNSSENQESEPMTKREYVSGILSQKLGRETTNEDIERFGSVVASLMDKTRATVNESGKELDESTLFKSMVDTLDESHGNFNGIFPEDKVSWNQFLDGLTDDENVAIKTVKPEEYFENVGNGMNVTTHKQSVEKIRAVLQEKDPVLAEQFLSDDPNIATQAALDILNHSEYVYGILDKEMVQDALSQGYDHIAHARFQLEQLAEGKMLAPSLVAKYEKSEGKFGTGISKTILDGTHRALSAAYANQPLFLIEVDMDLIKRTESADSKP